MIPGIRNICRAGILPGLLISGVLYTLPLRSLDISVSLFHDQPVSSVVLTVVEGAYRVRGEGFGPIHCYPGSSWYLMNQGDSIFFRDHRRKWKVSGELVFTSADEYSVFSLKPANPSIEAAEFMGDLRVYVSHQSLRLLNRIPLETYVTGVAESEAGPFNTLEYYKVQAILCRTFALRNLDRHNEEGFNLCDGVHCQSYKGRHRWGDDVEIATEVTEALVICDGDSLLINPVYHSNSGGETQGAEKVWLETVPYLRPVLDPFSLGQRNSTWERSISLRDWILYLRSHGIVLPGELDTAALEMRQEHRSAYYRVLDDSLPVSRIREDFRYRSDFFDVLAEGDMIRINGRGYGHGIGLSQEGAMEMARRRYHYTAILNYYYHDIMILPYFNLKALFSQGPD